MTSVGSEGSDDLLSAAMTFSAEAPSSPDSIESPTDSKSSKSKGSPLTELAELEAKLKELGSEIDRTVVDTTQLSNDLSSSGKDLSVLSPVATIPRMSTIRTPAATPGNPLDDYITHFQPNSREQHFLEVNRALQNAGLPVMTIATAKSIGEATVESDSLLAVIQQVLDRLERRGELLNDLLQQVDRASSAEASFSDRHLALQKDTEKLKATEKEQSRSLEMNQQKVMDLERQLQQDQQTFSAQVKDYKRKITLLEHKLSSKENELDRVKERLSVEAAKQSVSKEKDREKFETLLKRSPRRASPKDSQSLEVIRLYEKQKQAMQRDLDSYEEEVARLNEELRQARNTIAFKDRDEGGGWKSPKTGDILRRLDSAQREMENAGMRCVAACSCRVTSSSAQKAEEELKRQLHGKSEDLSKAKKRIARLMDETENLRLELESRPTPRDWSVLNRKTEELRAKLAKSRRETEVAHLNKFLSTREKIRRDKDDFKLELHRVEKLPKDVLVELTKESCRQLSVGTVTEIPERIEKLKAVVAAVPMLQRFVNEVKTMLGVAQSKDSPSATPIMESCLQKIKDWASQLAELAATKRALEKLSVQYHKLQASMPVQDSSLGVDTVSSSSDPKSVSERQRRKMFDKLRQDGKHEVAHGVKTEDVMLYQKITRHFQTVFEVPELQGVIPKMNELYMLMQELRTNLRMLRPLVGVEDDAPYRKVMLAVRQCLHEHAEGLDGEKSVGSENLSFESTTTDESFDDGEYDGE